LVLFAVKLIKTKIVKFSEKGVHEKNRSKRKISEKSRFFRREVIIELEHVHKP